MFGARWECCSKSQIWNFFTKKFENLENLVQNPQIKTNKFIKNQNFNMWKKIKIKIKPTSNPHPPPLLLFLQNTQKRIESEVFFWEWVWGLTSGDRCRGGRGGRRVVAFSLSLSGFKNGRYFVTIGLYVLVIRTTLFCCQIFTFLELVI